MTMCKITAYGYHKECLTWCDKEDLDNVEDRLRDDGYFDLRIEEEE